MLIDTHVHLYVEEFKNDQNEVIQRAINEGVTKFYLPAIDSSYHTEMEFLKNRFPHHIHLMMGLHPCYVKTETLEYELEKVYEKLISHSYAAIGEIGLDLYWDKTTFALQKTAFIQQIQWAKEFDLPIVIHARESTEEILTLLEKENSTQIQGIFHCFSGDIFQAKRAISLGFLLGIGGVVTFKNGKIDQFLHEIPLEKIVLETDAPYLAPVPFRGKRNEPSYLPYIVGKLVDIYGCSSDEIIQTTTQSALNIFKT